MFSLLIRPRSWLTGVFVAISFGLSAQTLTIDGGSVSIQSGVTVFVQGDVLNQGAGSIENSGQIEVTGNLTNNGTGALAAGRFLFVGGTPQSVSGSQNTIFGDLVLINSTGLTLNQNVSVDNVLELVTGNLNLNGQTIELSEVATMLGESDNSRVFGTSGTIRTARGLGALNSDNIANLGLELTTASAMGATVIIRGHGPQSVGSGNSIARYFEVDASENANLDATLRMYYFPSELNGQDAASLSLFRLNSGATNWTPAGGTSDVGGSYVEQSGIDAMALWTLSADGTTGLDSRPELAMMVYPNPLSSGESLKITGLKTGTYQLNLFDARGRQVMQQEIQSVSAESETSLSLPSIAKGVYTLRLQHPDFQPTMGKLVLY